MKLSAIATELAAIQGDLISTIRPALQVYVTYVTYVKAFGLDSTYLSAVCYGVDKSMAAGATFNQACHDAASTLATRITELVSEVVEFDAAENGKQDLADIDNEDYLNLVSYACSWFKYYFGVDYEDAPLDEDGKFTISERDFDVIDTIYDGYPCDMIANRNAPELDTSDLVLTLMDLRD